MSTIKQEIKFLIADVLEITDVDILSDDVAVNNCLEWDSFAHINLLVAIQEKYKIVISPEEIAYTLRLSDIVDFVQYKLITQKSIFSKSFISCDELFSKLWREDKLEEDDTIYIHSSLKNLLNICNMNINEILDWLRGGKNGRRTLVFPAFPFSSSTYEKYIVDRQCFSVLNTPTATGLLSEMVRRKQDTFRSAHPILSESAIGPKAEWITKDSHINSHPFHKKSTYVKLLELNAVMIGLGVDINTNAIIHMVDDILKAEYPFDVYVKELLDFEIEMTDGSIINNKFIAYSPDIIKKIKPRNLRNFFVETPHILKEFEIEGIWFYRLRLKPFLEKCEKIARENLKKGSLPPWYG